METMNRPEARFLMCRPEHFAVSYAINPWMDPVSWARDERAHFRRALALMFGIVDEGRGHAKQPHARCNGRIL
jgi:hypothetical protein